MSLMDDAQKASALFEDIAISNQLAKSQASGAGFAHCQESGIEIPAARRAAIPNCSTCTGCQELLEINAQHYRR